MRIIDPGQILNEACSCLTIKPLGVKELADIARVLRKTLMNGIFWRHPLVSEPHVDPLGRGVPSTIPMPH